MTRHLLFWFAFSTALSILVGQEEQGHIEAGTGHDRNRPQWDQDHKLLYISIPLEESNGPFKLKGTVRDSNSAVVREFDDKDVKGPLFYKELPALPHGTYHLKVTIINKTGTTKELDSELGYLSVASRSFSVNGSIIVV